MKRHLQGRGVAREAGRLYQSLRGRLYRRLPVLAVPLGLLDWRQGEAAGTDGAYFYAPPDWLAAADAEDVLLHSVLHAMLGHPWTRGRRDAARWDLACDMAAEFLRQRLLERRNQGKSVMLVSTDLGEILALSDRIAVIHGGRIMGIVQNTPDLSVELLGLMMGGVPLEEART